MKPKPTPTSPKTREEQRALEALYGTPTVTPPPRARLGLMLAVAAGIGLVTAVAGVAGLAAVSRRLPADAWVRQFIPEAAPTVIVRSTNATPEATDVTARLSEMAPVVVAIYSGTTATPQSSADLPTASVYRGNAVFVATTGLALTTKDVVAEPGGPFVALTSERRFVPVESILFDPVSPFALLTLAAGNYSAAKFAVDDDAIVGRSLTAIGPLQGAAETVGYVPATLAALSARGDDASFGEATESLAGSLLVTASAVPAGTPFVTDRNEVIGLARPAGAGNRQLVAPLWYAQPALRLALRGQDILRPSLGVQYVDLARSPRPASAGDATAGALVTGIAARSPASAVGLRVGDVIIEVQSVLLDSVTRLNELIQTLTPGETVTLRVRRGTAEQQLDVTLGTTRA